MFNCPPVKKQFMLHFYNNMPIQQLSVTVRSCPCQDTLRYGVCPVCWSMVSLPFAECPLTWSGDEPHCALEYLRSVILLGQGLAPPSEVMVV